MKPNEGRLQSAEHILAKILENKIPDAEVRIAKFKEESGLFEVMSKSDLRELNMNEIEEDVNKIIGKEIPVHKSILKREEAEKEVNLKKVPASIQEITIIDFKGFDKRPCRDPHVNNTKEIGKFAILSLDRVGENRYRFIFKVE